jgi:hypothetical protein
VIGALVSLLSLNTTLLLVQAGQVAGTLPITSATTTTPIAVTVANHGVPLGRVIHGVSTGVGGMPEADGLWVFTPTDPNTFTLSTFNAAGNTVQSVGVGTYTSGGTIQYAFPDYQILLGRRWLARSSSPASPRIVMVPTDEGAWTYDPLGGDPTSLTEYNAATLQPQYETQTTTFEVFVQGCANPPSPDFSDFDATQAIVWTLRQVMREAVGLPRCAVLSAGWPSQLPANHPMAVGLDTSRGQMWRGIVRFEQAVTVTPLQFAPPGTSLVFDITTVQGGSTDDVILTVTPGGTPV